MVDHTRGTRRSVFRGASKRNCAWSLQCLSSWSLVYFSSTFLATGPALRSAGMRALRLLAMLPLFVPYAQERYAMSVPTALMVVAILQALSYLAGLPGGMARRS